MQFHNLEKIFGVNPRYVAEATRRAMGNKGVNSSKYTALTSQKWARKHVKSVKKAILEISNEKGDSYFEKHIRQETESHHHPRRVSEKEERSS